MNNNLLVLAAVGVVAFLLLKKNDPTHQPAIPGASYQPPYPTTVTYTQTGGPVGTLTQELNQVSTAVSTVGAITGQVADVFGRLGMGNDTEVVWPE